VSRMNWVGAALCVLVFAGSFLLSEGASRFFNLTGLAIVLSGTVGAALLSYPWKNLRAAWQVAWNAYAVEPPSEDEVVSALAKFSVHSRRDGMLSLERFEKKTSVSFLRHALEMLVDGYEAREMREILSTEMSYFRQRRTNQERVFRHLARLAPAFGVAGSVVGLMSLLLGVGDTAVVIRTIPLALTSTLYGIVLANFFLTPAAEAIHAKTQQELLVMRLAADGALAVLAEQNPHKLEKKLESFLTPSTRTGSQRSLEEMRERFIAEREHESEEKQVSV